MSMTPEEQKAADAAKAEADEKAEADARANETDADKKAREQTEREASLKKSYEDELIKERAAREKAEKAMADAAYKKRHEEEEEGGEEDHPLTRAELQSILERERQLTRVETHRESIEGRIRSLATSVEEGNLMIEVSKNRTFPSHYSPEDVAEEVYAIANRKKLRLERDEALRALAEKDNANRTGTGGHHDSVRAGEPKMTDIDKGEYTRLGFSWNGTSRRYEKRLSNGSLLVKDPQTKRVVLIRKSS